DIKMRLVGSNPLWGHYLWNAAKRLANYLDEHTELIKNKNVVELGAAAGLPSLISTDYPDRELIENLGFNFRKNVPEMVNNGQALVKGYIWGNSTEGLMEIIEPDQEYDLILLSDLIFNHSQHHALLKSCRELLGASASNNLPRQQKPQRASSSPLISKKSNGQVLVFFTHHRPWLADRDMKFFELAESPEYGFRVEKVLEEY
ncbi:Protein N-terminal and lysine N-methyltransferase efm7, partial [Spiromyces aspiralis]